MQCLPLLAQVLIYLTATAHAVQLSFMKNTRPRHWRPCRSSSFDEVRVPFADEHKKVFACCHSKKDPPFESNDGGKEKESKCCFPHMRPIDNESQLPCCGHGKKTEKNGKTVCIKRDIEETIKFVKENGTECTIKDEIKRRSSDTRYPFEYELVQQDKTDQDYKKVHKLCCLTANEKDKKVTEFLYACCMPHVHSWIRSKIDGRSCRGCMAGKLTHEDALILEAKRIEE